MGVKQLDYLVCGCLTNEKVNMDCLDISSLSSSTGLEDSRISSGNLNFLLVSFKLHEGFEISKWADT